MTTGEPADFGAEPIALIGMRGVGKTSLGRALARELACGFVDLDEAIAWSDSEGCCAEHVSDVAHVIERLGWDGFREREAQELRRVLAAGGRLVLATGGGVVERADNREHLSRCARCVWLRQDLDVVRARLRAAPNARPSLTGAAPEVELDELWRRREPWYREIASVTLDAGDASPAQLAKLLATRLAAD